MSGAELEGGFGDRDPVAGLKGNVRFFSALDVLHADADDGLGAMGADSGNGGAVGRRNVRHPSGLDDGLKHG